MSDSIADMLIRIKNAYAVNKEAVEIPFSHIKREIAKILTENDFVKDYRKVDRKGKKFVRVYLKYDDEGTPALREAKKVSKPGQRIYKKADDIPYVKNGYGIGIISTSSGVLTDKEARRKNVGGEFLCKIW